MAQGNDLGALLTEIDGYIQGLFAPQDEALEAAVRESQRAGLPEINVSPNEGRLLRLLAEITGARRTLEIGTLGGYSATNLARGMADDGRLISLEIDEHHAEVARNNIARAGLSDKVEILVGDAHELLAALIEDLESNHTGIKERLIDNGELRRFVNVYVNDEDVRFTGALDTQVKDGDSVTILPAVAGG